MEKIAKVALLLALALNTVQGDMNNDMMNEFKPLMDRAMAMNTLNYKDTCDYKLEQERQTQGKALLNLLSNLNFQNLDLGRMKNQMSGIMNSLANLNGKLCKSYENLQCNTKGFCDCAEADESLGFKASFTREGNECVLKGGSICAPQDVLSQSRASNPLAQNAPEQKLTCAAGSKCIIKSSGETCDQQKMQAEIQRMMKSAGQISNPISFVMEKTKEGICVCKGASAVASALLVGICAIYLSAKSFF